MQLVERGPDIPLQVMSALEAGELVLFCGAGVSRAAGLPLYASFVTDLFGDLRLPMKVSDREAMDRWEYDRIVSTLVARTDEATVRSAACRLLQTPANPDLSTHRAIIELARTRDGCIRVVTTNFDDLFEESAPELRQRVMCAPRLPIAKPEHWNGLVHLHGHIADPLDTDRRRLVLTAGDFGAAYLTERWASRFVSEIFQRFTVLFVGYSVGDPVMRYLVDAIAAERRIDPTRAKQPYVFSDCRPDTREQREAQWRAGGIEPLLYDDSDGHGPLHATLKGWARLWSGGLSSRLNIITDLAPKDPHMLSRDVDIPQLLWALQEPSGAGARHFADKDTKANLAWIEVFGGSTSPSGALLEGVVTKGAVEEAPLAAVKSGLAFWLTAHLGDLDLIRWTVASGAVLHPGFARWVRSALRQQSDLHPVFRRFWTALSGSLPIGRTNREAHFQDTLCGRIDHEPWSVSLRGEVLSALSPRVILSPPWSGWLPKDEEPHLSGLASVECMPETQFVWEFVLTPLLGRADWPSSSQEVCKRPQAATL